MMGAVSSAIGSGMSPFPIYFWRNAVLRLDRYCRKCMDNPFIQVKDRREQQRVIEIFTTIEGYALFSSITLGIIQMLCLMYEGKILTAFIIDSNRLIDK